MNYTIKVTRNGQITIPAEIRNQLGIKQGSELMIGIDEKYGKTILMEKLPDMPSWDELLKDVPVIEKDGDNDGE